MGEGDYGAFCHVGCVLEGLLEAGVLVVVKCGEKIEGCGWTC